MKNIDPLNLVITATSALAIGIGSYLFVTIVKPTFPFFAYHSPYLLDLTSPVYAFTGTVVRINGQTIWVQQTPLSATTSAPGPAAGNLTPTPTPKPHGPLTFQIKATSMTSINKSPTAIPYLFGQVVTPTPTPNSPISQITIGDVVTVGVDHDLRITNPNNLTATSINVSAKPFQIDGAVTNTQGDIITLTGTYSLALPTGGSQTKSNSFSVSILPDTQIGQRGMPTALKPGAADIHLTTNDLKPGTHITIYTDQDVSQTNSINAKVIEVIPPGPLGIPSLSTPKLPAPVLPQ